MITAILHQVVLDQSQDSGYNHDSPSTPEHNPDGGTHDDSSGGASGTEEGGAGRTP